MSNAIGKKNIQPPPPPPPHTHTRTKGSRYAHSSNFYIATVGLPEFWHERNWSIGQDLNWEFLLKEVLLFQNLQRFSGHNEDRKSV
jgi:hypothetical protein